jgi:homoserine kinase
MRLRCRNRIPLMSGLGSSAAAVVGGLALAAAWLGRRGPWEELLELATALEGHPDNVAPALLGGLTLVTRDEEGLIAARVSIPPMRVALALPAVQVSTEMARRLLPAQFPLSDVVAQIGHVALLVHAFREGDWRLLGRAMRDRVHEPYRARLIPGYAQAVQAARAAGAAAVCISGSGPALAAFAPEGHEAIAAAMAAAFEEAGFPARTWVVDVEPQGVQVEVEPDPNLSVIAGMGSLFQETSMEFLRRMWRAFQTIAILFSFTVNLILVIALGLLYMQLASLKSAVNGTVARLEAIVQDLGDTRISTTIPIRQSVPVAFELPVQQDTVVVTLAPVPITTAATFQLPGGGGTINGTVFIHLPPGTRLPVRLNMTVPVRTQIPVNFDQPVDIALGASGLDPVVGKLLLLLKDLKALLDLIPGP